MKPDCCCIVRCMEITEFSRLAFLSLVEMINFDNILELFEKKCVQLKLRWIYSLIELIV